MNLRPMLFLLLLLCAPVLAIEPMPFKDQAEEARFRTLAAELRCLMCQNQSLADSPSGIAQDLRREVLELMQQGLTDAQIKQHLVERYGDFVLYRTPVRGGTWLLWFGPGALLLIGAIGLVVIVRRRAPKSTGGPPPEPEEPR
jgi:cytochrome c-type biogenesis protein CcmH